MTYRLTQSHYTYGAYGRLLTGEEYDRIPWYDRALCEPYVSLEGFDFTVAHYKDGKELPNRKYAFYNSEGSDAAAVMLNGKLYTVSNINKLAGNPLNGYCIVIIKNIPK